MEEDRRKAVVRYNKERTEEVSPCLYVAILGWRNYHRVLSKALVAVIAYIAYIRTRNIFGSSLVVKCGY